MSMTMSKLVFYLLTILFIFHPKTRFAVNAKEIVLTDSQGTISDADVSSNDTDTVWHIVLQDVCQTQIRVLEMEFEDDCDFIAVVSGPALFNNSKILLLTEKSIKKNLIVTNYDTYIVPVSHDGLLKYKIAYDCSINVINATQMYLIPIPFNASDDYKLNVCIINLNLSLATQLSTRDSSAQLNFLAFVKDLFEKNFFACQCPKGVVFRGHFHWPMYVQYTCKYSTKTLNITNQYCVCFNLSVEVVASNDKTDNCRTGSLLTRQQLRNVIGTTIDMGEQASPYEMYAVPEKDPMYMAAYIAVPIALCIICMLAFVGVYKMANHMERSKKPKVQKDLEPTDVFVRNPMFRESFACNLTPGLENPCFFGDDFVEGDGIKTTPTMPGVRKRSIPNMMNNVRRDSRANVKETNLMRIREEQEPDEDKKDEDLTAIEEEQGPSALTIIEEESEEEVSNSARSSNHSVTTLATIHSIDLDMPEIGEDGEDTEL